MRCKEKVADCSCLDTKHVVETLDDKCTSTGKKTWEIRSRPTNIRCHIALAEAGSGKIIASARIVDCKLISCEDMAKNHDHHQIPLEEVGRLVGGYKQIYAWILEDAEVFAKPRRYHHPRGAPMARIH